MSVNSLKAGYLTSLRDFLQRLRPKRQPLGNTKAPSFRRRLRVQRLEERIVFDASFLSGAGVALDGAQNLLFSSAGDIDFGSGLTAAGQFSLDGGGNWSVDAAFSANQFSISNNVLTFDLSLISDGGAALAVGNVLQIQGTADNSNQVTVQLDSTNDLVPTGGIHFDGGSGSDVDSLTIEGFDAASVDVSLNDSTTGVVDLAGESISFAQVSNVNLDATSADLTIELPNGDDATVQVSGTATETRLQGDFTTIEFATPTDFVEINNSFGARTIDLQGVSSGFGADLNLTDGDSNDSITVSSTLLLDNSTLTVLGADTVNLEADITTSGGDVSFDVSSIVLENDVTIDSGTGSIEFLGQLNTDDHALTTVATLTDLDDGLITDLDSTPAISASGSVRVAGDLDLNFSQAPDHGDVFALVENSSMADTTGTFTGIAENSVVTVDGFRFLASYDAGTASNNVALTAQLPIYDVTTTSISVAEGDTATVLIDRSGDTSIASTVNVSVAAGSASVNDYDVPLSREVNFAAGQTQAQFDLSTVQDSVVEADETLTVALVAPTAGAGVLGTQTATQITVNNDDTTSISLTPIQATADEGSSGTTSLTFRIALTNAVQGGFSIDHTVSDGTADSGSDYTDNDGTLSFAGNANESHIVTVLVAGDQIVETNETLQVALASSVTGTATGIDQADISVNDTAVMGTITNDDFATITIANLIATEANANTTEQTTVTVDKAVQGGFSLQFGLTTGTAESNDVSLASNTVSFAGTAGESQQIDITISGDSIVEDNETFTIGFSQVTADTSVQNAAIDFSDQATAVINNDDTAEISISDLTTNEATGTATFTVSSTLASEEDLSVSVSLAHITTSGTEVTLPASTAVIAGDSATQTASVTVSIADDRRVEGDETFSVTISQPTYNGVDDASRAIVDDAVGVGTIVDNDSFNLSFDQANSDVDEDTTTTTVSASLQTNTSGFGTIGIDQDVSFDIEVSGGTATDTSPNADFSFSTQSLLFAAADGAVFTDDVTVNIFEDISDDDAETIELSFASIVDGTQGQLSTSTTTHTILINDDDGAQARLDLVPDGGDVLIQANGNEIQVLIDGNLLATRPIIGFEGLTIVGTSSDETVTVDASSGTFDVAIDFQGASGDDLLRIIHPAVGVYTPTGGILFSGGIGDDTLELLNGSATSVEHRFDNNHDGRILLNGSTAVEYTGLAPIVDTVTATTRTFSFLGASETIVLSDDATAGDDISLIDSTLGESVAFLTATDSVTINTEAAGGSGIDLVQVQGLDSSWNSDLIINAGTDDRIEFQSVATTLNSGDLITESGTIDVAAALTVLSGDLSFTADSNLTTSAAITANDGTTTVDAINATFNGTLDGSNDVTLDVTGATVFNAAVGSVSDIGDGTGPSIRILNSGTTTFVSTVRTNNGLQQADTAGLLTFLDNVTINGAQTGTQLDGNVTLNSLTFDTEGTFTAGNSSADLLSIIGTDVTIQTAARDIRLDASTTLQTNLNLNSSSGNIDLQGPIDGGHRLDISAGTGDVTWNSSIGTTTALNSLVVNSANQTQVNATANAQSIFITSNRIDGSGLLTALTDINLNAVSGIGSATTIQVATPLLTADSTNGNINIVSQATTVTEIAQLTTGTGNIDFQQTGNQALQIDHVETTSGNITLSNDADVSVDGSVIAGGSGNVVLTTTGSGNISLPGVITADLSTVTLNSAGTIEGDSESLLADITAATLNLTAVNGIGNSLPLELAVANLTVSNTTGNIQFTNNGTLDLQTIQTSGDIEVCVTSGNLNLNDNVNTNGGTLRFSAAAGEVRQLAGTISTDTFSVSAANAITLNNANDSATFAASSTSGAISYVDVNGFSVGQVSAGTCTIAVVGVTTSVSGSVSLLASGPLTVDQQITSRGPTTVRTTTGRLELNAAVTTDGQDATFEADSGQIFSSANGTVSTTANSAGSDSGNISFQANQGIDLSGQLTTNGLDNAISATAGDAGSIQLSTDDGSILLNADVSAVGGQTTNPALNGEGGTITLTAADTDASNNDGNITVNQSLQTSTEVGGLKVDVTAARDISVDTITASGTDTIVSLTAGQDIVDINDSGLADVNVSADDGEIRLSAVRNIGEAPTGDFFKPDGTGNPFEVQAGILNILSAQVASVAEVDSAVLQTLTADTAFLSANGDLDFSSSVVSTDNLSLVASGTLTLPPSSSPLVVADDLFIDAKRIESANGIIDVTADRFLLKSGSSIELTIHGNSGGTIQFDAQTTSATDGNLTVTADTPLVLTDLDCDETAINVGNHTAVFQSNSVVQQADQTATVDYDSAILADNLILNGPATYELTNARNDINSLAGSNSGSIAFRDADDVAIDRIVAPSNAVIVGLTTGGADVLIEAGTTLSLEESIHAGSADVRLIAHGDILQAATGSIIADELGIRQQALSGTVSLTADNDVRTTAISNGGQTDTIAISDSNDLSIASLSAASIGTISFQQTAGLTTVDGNILVQTGASLSLQESVHSGTNDVRIISGDHISQTASGTIQAEQLGIRQTGNGSIVLDELNLVNDLAIHNAGNGIIGFRNNQALTIGTVDSFRQDDLTFLQTEGINTADGDALLNINGGLSIESAVSLGNADLRLVTNGTIDQNASSGAITVDNLGINQAAGTVLLTAANSIGTVAVSNNDSLQQVAISNTTDLVIGNVADQSVGSLSYQSTDGITTTNGDILVTSDGSLDLEQAVNAGIGDVRLAANGNIQQTTDGIILADQLAVRQESTAGDIILDDANDVTTVALLNSAQSAVTGFSDTNNLLVDTVSFQNAAAATVAETSGITTANGNTVIQAGGSLQLNQAISVGSGTLGVRTNGEIQQTTSGIITAQAVAIQQTAAATDVVLDDANQIGTIAVGQALNGKVAIANSQDLIIGEIDVDAIGGLNLSATNGLTTTDSDIFVQADGNILINESIDVGTSDIYLVAAGNIGQSLNGTLHGVQLGVRQTASSGNILLDADNQVQIFAASNEAAGGTTTFNNLPDLTIGIVASATCGEIMFDSTDGLQTSDGNIYVNSESQLTIQRPVSAGTGNVRLVADGNISQSSTGVITADQLGVRQESATGAVLLDDGNDVQRLAILNQADNAPIVFNDIDSITVAAINQQMSGRLLFSATEGIVSSQGDILLQSEGADRATSIQLENAVHAGVADIRLIGNGTIDQLLAGTITASNFGLIQQSITGDIHLGAADNAVDVLAASNAAEFGSITFFDADDLVIGTVTGQTLGEVTFTAVTGVDSNAGDINLTSVDDLTVAQDVNAAHATLTTSIDESILLISQQANFTLLDGTTISTDENPAPGEFVDITGDQITIIAGADNPAAGVVNLGDPSTVEIRTDGGVARQIAPRPQGFVDDSALTPPETALVTLDSAENSRSSLNFVAGGFLGELPLIVGVAGEENLEVVVDWGVVTQNNLTFGIAGDAVADSSGRLLFDFADSDKTIFYADQGGQTYILPHLYQPGDLTTTPNDRNGRQINPNIIGVRFSVAQHESINIWGTDPQVQGTNTGPAAGDFQGTSPTLVDANGNPITPANTELALLSSTDNNNLRSLTQQATDLPLDNIIVTSTGRPVGQAEFEFIAGPSPGIVFYEPTERPTQDLPRVAVPTPAFVSTEIIGDVSFDSGAASDAAIGTEVYLQIRRAFELDAEPEVVIPRITDSNFISDRDQFETFVQDNPVLQDGSGYEVWLITETGGQQVARPIVKFDITGGEPGPATQPLPETFAPYRLEEVEFEQAQPATEEPQPLSDPEALHVPNLRPEQNPDSAIIQQDPVFLAKTASSPTASSPTASTTTASTTPDDAGPISTPTDQPPSISDPESATVAMDSESVQLSSVEPENDSTASIVVAPLLALTATQRWKKRQQAHENSAAVDSDESHNNLPQINSKSARLIRKIKAESTPR